MDSMDLYAFNFIDFGFLHEKCNLLLTIINFRYDQFTPNTHNAHNFFFSLFSVVILYTKFFCDEHFCFMTKSHLKCTHFGSLWSVCYLPEIDMVFLVHTPHFMQRTTNMMCINKSSALGETEQFDVYLGGLAQLSPKLWYILKLMNYVCFVLRCKIKMYYVKWPK